LEVVFQLKELHLLSHVTDGGVGPGGVGVGPGGVGVGPGGVGVGPGGVGVGPGPDPLAVLVVK